jgi:hypothetical protein
MNEPSLPQSQRSELDKWVDIWKYLDAWEQQDCRDIEDNIAETSKLRWRHKQGSGFHSIGESLSRMFRQKLLIHISNTGENTGLKQIVRDKILELQRKNDQTL